ncbi:hypothetical protein CPC08DRAFT_812702 [Agrocybe pediades]|nr:hypothetical protein CPC08DRAFT_812702 [Agrocybe pediades]
MSLFPSDQSSIVDHHLSQPADLQVVDKDSPDKDSQAPDAVSVHSMPNVHTTQPAAHSAPTPSSPGASDDTSPIAPLPRSNTIQEESSVSQTSRNRHRSSVEPRSSNRLSGFFNNLIHRRDPLLAPSRDPIREDAARTEPPPSNSEVVSRSPSPLPIRPSTPPPSLPAPTLYELGLSLSALTSELNPSHFSTPPSSGAFLAPHYLLLCHAQGLDVLPLVSPPAPQPYALVRRVSFKSVVVMEQRGVLVAIAGRRDGVRVYALEEVKKAIEWRIEVEVRRERDRNRRENVKKSSLRNWDISDVRDSVEKNRKASLSSVTPTEPDRARAKLLRKSSHNPLPTPPSPPPVPLVPRSATPRAPKRRPKPPIEAPPESSSTLPVPSGQPPPYAGPSDISHPTLQSRPSFVSLRSRGGSVSNVLAVPPIHRAVEQRPQDDSKADWAESSDEEAIDVVAAGSSGSHLDERTSATLSRTVSSPSVAAIGSQPVPVPVPSRPSLSNRRNRPSNLDLSLTQAVPPPEPSPAPTLITLRQALSHAPQTSSPANDEVPNPETPLPEEDDDDEGEGYISLAQALLESRIPDLPPVGTRRPQEPILITPSTTLARSETPSSARSFDGQSSLGRSTTNSTNRRRRRWSIMISSPSSETAPDLSTVPSGSLTAPGTGRTTFSRSQSFRSDHSHTPAARSATNPLPSSSSTTTLLNPPVPSVPDNLRTPTPTSSRSSRFIPRIISNALNSRKSTDRPLTAPSSPIDIEGTRWTPSNQAPPPKLEYVKLPGTKGAMLIKAVETAKKSFLAILCGENGEKVELFAGTYRTALGLSRTFILPDSPRSLELQLQGDDLVEVFLVFAQNVFGLEPATVRVREVRIGRAERRAARRRAREAQPGEPPAVEPEQVEEETNVNVSIGISVPVNPSTPVDPTVERPGSPTLFASEHPSAQRDRPPTPEPASASNNVQSEELVMLATAQMGPYTTFQQLTFAPNFPLASIADEYIIPPTYPSFLEYKAQHEPENGADLTQTQFSPPGLPVPTPTAPPKWYYRDPKNVVHGPWKSSLMQAWYKDGLLPPDLPVRREEDTEYTLLKDLRLQSVDPTQPFRTAGPLTDPPASLASDTNNGMAELTLLKPISLLEQPRHFGPPALFFSSRGGHSTAVVDARGRSVLKGKFVWSNDQEDLESSSKRSSGKMGEIRRLEAFDVDKGSVLVAVRQGGLEVVNLGDALLKPADESRTMLPHYNPPPSNINRRAPYVWKIGTPLSSTSATSSVTSNKGYPNSLSAGKRSGIALPKSVHGRSDAFSGDFDSDLQDEVLFLGRKEDEVYFCEKNSSSFRILKLSPDIHDTFQ